MKRIGLICALLATSINGFAQFDDPLIVANRSLKMSSSEPVLGTARYSGMAGAMGALGGDGAAVKDNPAALGIYRKWDIGITPNVNIDNDANADFNINNFSLVMNFGDKKRKKGYVTSSFAIAYNRIANFNRDTYTNGTNNNGFYSNEFTEDDGSGIWNFAYGMNISNKVFVGLGLNAASLSYKQTTEYSDGGGWEEHLLDVDGSGFNLTLGVIGRPNKVLRLGASFTTPTWYSLNECAAYPPIERYDIYDSKYIDEGYGFDGQREPAAEYKLQSPLKAEASVGFILGKRAMIDVDYIFQDFSTMRVKDDRGHQYRDAKYFIDRNYQATHTLKLGAEVQIAKGFAARAGYAMQTSPTKADCYGRDIAGEDLMNHGMYVPYYPENTNAFQSYAIQKGANYFTLGAGYHGKHFYADLAYVNKRQKEDFYEWQEAAYVPAVDDRGEAYDKFDGWVNAPIKQTLITHNIMATIGCKF